MSCFLWKLTILGLQVHLYHGVKTPGHPLQDCDGYGVEEVEDEAEAVLGQVEQAGVALKIDR